MNPRISFVVLFGVLAIGTWHISDGQVQLSGPCPNVPVMPNFNIKAYMGLWYEAAKYPARFETGGKCITADYELLDNGTVKVVNTQFNKLIQEEIQIEGTAEAVDNAKLLVQFPGQPEPTGSNYWVLETDYKSYSVVLSCIESENDSDSLPASHSLIVWILTRDREPSMDTSIKALLVLTGNDISLNYLTITDQENC